MSNSSASFRRAIWLIVRVVLFLAAAWAIRGELASVSPSELAAQLRSYGAAHLWAALACTVASFLLLGAIELMALRDRDVVGTSRVGRGRGLLTSFVANALSQSIGLSVVTGAAVRARSYGQRGLDTLAVARVSAFVTISITLGLIAAGAWALLGSSEPLRILHHSIGVRPLGWALVALLLAYLGWSVLHARSAIGFGKWTLRRPAPKIAGAQLALASADWILTGAVLFVFLPPTLGIAFSTLLRGYMIAQLVGVTSHVPAGAGVLEIMFLAQLADGVTNAERAALAASLVMFRIIYYLLPLCVALAVAAGSELRPGQEAHVGAS
ncbi:MAG: putative rane protein [Gemmatimonadetes bacterium]|nr:putative rane protein [Gemmatimonadota bacterium]